MRRMAGRVLRDEEGTYGPASTRFRVTLRLADELPPLDAVSAAHCLAFDGDAIVLARHVTREWTIPGGHLEAGETPLDAMHREAAEEAGAVVTAPHLLAVERIERIEGPAISDRYANPSFQVFFAARLVHLGEPTALDECTESRRFGPDEARRAPGWVQDQRELYEEALRWATTS
jgi:8-oxo-dGTP pyrophosphatase MutT (NUDIX family)